MNIQGLQKLTLLDFPEHVACTIFTGGCQLDCPFCHNSELIAGPFAEGIGQEEVLTFLKKRQGMLDGVAITGGEPMIQADLEAFIRDVKAMGYQVKLDTNGGFPEKLQKLVLHGKKPITCRPGELLPEEDFDGIKKLLVEKYGLEGTEKEALSYALYPKVFEDYLKSLDKEGDFRLMGSDIFFHGLSEGDQTSHSRGCADRRDR